MDKPKKIRKKPKHHPEAKGLAFIAFSVLLLLSLISFNPSNFESNYLGITGHFIAFLFQYCIGFGSYLIAIYAFWLGYLLIKSKDISIIATKMLYFSLFLISTCLLLNAAAETKLIKSPLILDRIYSESVVIHPPYPARYTRYYLGGVPLYYLYCDLPGASLKILFSTVGVVFISSTIFLVSLILLSDFAFLAVIKHLALMIFTLLLKIHKAILSWFEQKEEIPVFVEEVKRPSYPYAAIRKQISRPLKERKEEPIEEAEEVIEAPVESLPKEIHSSLQISLQGREQKTIAEKPALLEKLLEAKTLKSKSSSNYALPPLHLLTNAAKVDQPSLKKDLAEQAEILEETLASFGIEAKVGEINCGPTITSFEVHPAIGVKVQKITALSNDIALKLQAKSIRIIAPIPGKAAVGVEVPSPYPQEVGFKEMLFHYRKSNSPFQIPILLGKTVSGEQMMCDLTKMPHCIIAGATGSGKSVCINTIIMSMLMNMGPDELKLILIDPKKVELTPYTRLPHMIAPVITEPSGAYAALHWIVKEMTSRYELLKVLGVRNIASFNQRKINHEVEQALDIEIPEKLPFIVAIIDEFADLMMSANADLETPIARIAQMARAVGIHMILATQRPSREVITGLIKANFPCRIAFKVASRINSQIILDETGAESLLGNGDMLFLPPGTSELLRAQGAYLRDEDINRVIDYICSKYSTDYLFNSFDQLSSEQFDSQSSSSGGDRDPLYQKALDIVTSSKAASTTFLQRKLKIGYARAASLIDELESNGIIGPQDGSKPRRVLISRPGFSSDDI
ncbi:MAG: DNA translocase FtsK [Chlamydiae bacterium]|nr:DNA translocase FtsK [Chlamydiota bacterium]